MHPQFCATYIVCTLDCISSRNSGLGICNIYEAKECPLTRNSFLYCIVLIVLHDDSIEYRMKLLRSAEEVVAGQAQDVDFNVEADRAANFLLPILKRCMLE